MTELIPGIHQIKLPVPVKDSSVSYVNVYLIPGDGGALLVDAGLNRDEAFDSLKKQLADIGVDIKDISQIVITHAHYDHIGLLGKLKQVSQAKFSIHHLEKDFIETVYTDVAKHLEQSIHWMKINGMTAGELLAVESAPSEWSRVDSRVSPDFILHGGETISAGSFTFQVLWTPGHSAGHICLYEPTRKILISGDNILPTITPHIGLPSPSAGDPLDNYLNSLETLKSLDVELVLPGHEDPFTHFRPRIHEIMEHHKQRRAEIIEGLKSGPETAYQIAGGINWDYRGGWQKLPLLHKRLALMETLAHLESMRVAGKVDKLSRNGLIYYQST